MKTPILIILLISFTFSFANNSKNPNNIDVVKTIKDFNNISINESGIKTLDFTADTILKDKTYNVVDKIDFINIRKTTNQQIFSNKKGRKHYRNRYVEYVIFTNRNVLC